MGPCEIVTVKRIGRGLPAARWGIAGLGTEDTEDIVYTTFVDSLTTKQHLEHHCLLLDSSNLFVKNQTVSLKKDTSGYARLHGFKWGDLSRGLRGGHREVALVGRAGPA